MSQPACCTCATLLSAALLVYPCSEKPLPDDRALDCCGRTICGACIHRNPRFLSYCPYCQTSGRIRSPVTSRSRQRPSSTELSEDSSPPPYAAVANNGTGPSGPPPPYSASPTPSVPSATLLSTPYSVSEEKIYLNKNLPPEPQDEEEDQPQYTVHHLRHPPHPYPDTLASLSLQYGIPLPVLRHHNNLPRNADFLFFARRTLLIPTAYITNLKRLPNNTITTTTTNSSGGSADEALSLSLSPHPVEDEASRSRKTAIRRWMVACKEADYDAALVYLEASGYDLAEAVRAYLADAAWERENPDPNALQGGRSGSGNGLSKRGKGKGTGTVSGGIAGGGLLDWLKGRKE